MSVVYDIFGKKASVRSRNQENFETALHVCFLHLSRQNSNFFSEPPIINLSIGDIGLAFEFIKKFRENFLKDDTEKFVFFSFILDDSKHFVNLLASNNFNCHKTGFKNSTGEKVQIGWECHKTYNGGTAICLAVFEEKEVMENRFALGFDNEVTKDTYYYINFRLVA